MTEEASITQGHCPFRVSAGTASRAWPASGRRNPPPARGLWVRGPGSGAGQETLHQAHDLCWLLLGSVPQRSHLKTGPAGPPPHQASRGRCRGRTGGLWTVGHTLGLTEQLLPREGGGGCVGSGWGGRSVRPQGRKLTIPGVEPDQTEPDRALTQARLPELRHDGRTLTHRAMEQAPHRDGPRPGASWLQPQG